MRDTLVVAGSFLAAAAGSFTGMWAAWRFKRSKIREYLRLRPGIARRIPDPLGELMSESDPVISPARFSGERRPRT